MRRWIVLFAAVLGLVLFFWVPSAWAEPIPIPNIDLTISEPDSPREVVSSVRLLIFLTVISLLPAFMVMMTSFIRIVVVLAFLRMAMGTFQAPPGSVLIGLALFLTVFIMAPVYAQVNEEAIEPFLNEEIDQVEAQERAAAPLREFMLRHTREKDLNLFVRMADIEDPVRDELPITVVIPAFMISELKTAFTMGFVLYLPFLIIDIVVASILLSMGMFMLPPVMISLPFKLLLFILVDGWYLVVRSLVESFA
jgi:flagellar biosynthetic protein FliP